MGEVWVRTATVADSAHRRSLLDAGERDRLSRRKDPAPFVTGHALLRTLLADHLDTDPATLAFERRCATCGTDRHGKPSLVSDPDLHLSLSYSDHLAVACLTRLGAVGVDVEDHESADFDGFEEVTLAPAERPPFAALAGPDLLVARARVWARKEALLKATGHGLVVDPSEVVVSRPDAPAALVAWLSDRLAPGPATLADVPLDANGHEAAVAVLGAVALDVVTETVALAL